ncbi:MAG: alpha/beta fold hydrolase [Rhodospirillaceae bacterium]|nr:alpha/beta fold hydrolase [Rhodospirillaceae bacterium]
MADIVLVHGGWLGGWLWQKVAPLLRLRGHDVHAPSLTGLGDRRHLLSANITPDLHATDIVNVIRWNELKDVVLVGHSYGGFVISGAAGQVPDCVRAMVFVDAFVPDKSGQSAFSFGPEWRARQFRAASVRGMVQPQGLAERMSDDPATVEWVSRMVSAHPLSCFSEGTTLTGREKEIADRLCIWCTGNDPSPFGVFYERCAADPGWRTAVLPCRHGPMLDEPERLADLILSAC